MEEDFIIVKKIISQDPQQITYNNRYKIIDIADNAPEAVKYNFINIGEFNNSTTDVLTTAGIFPTAAEDLDKRIDERTDVVLVNRTPFEEGGGSSDLEIKQGIYLSWRKGNLYSDRYKVSDVSETGDVYTFRLSKKIKHSAGELSHGQKQWLEIGMLLAQEPQLLLVDEPAAGMSPTEREQTTKLLLKAAETRAVVVVEHDMEFIRRLNCRVTVLHEGSVLAEGSLDHVTSNQDVIDVYLGR